MGNTKFNPNQLPNTVAQTAKTTLTSAQLLALQATPIQVVSAPGTGFITRPTSVSFFFHPMTTPYATGSGNFVFKFGSNIVTSSLMSDGIIQETVEQVGCITPSVGVLGGGTFGDLSDYENKALLISQDGSGEFTNGDGTLTVVVQYNVEPIGS